VRGLYNILILWIFQLFHRRHMGTLKRMVSSTLKLPPRPQSTSNSFSLPSVRRILSVCVFEIRLAYHFLSCLYAQQISSLRTPRNPRAKHSLYSPPPPSRPRAAARMGWNSDQDNASSARMKIRN
jgi:hypothetical protein